jgi:hypothetical protein
VRIKALCSLALLSALCSFGQQAITLSESPPDRAFTVLWFWDPADSTKPLYMCKGPSSAKQTNMDVVDASNTNPAEITVGENHGLDTGALVTISQVQGNTAVNGTYQIVKTGATTFTIKTLGGANVAGNGAYVSNTGYATTSATRTNKANWAIKAWIYNVDGSLKAVRWVEGSTAPTHICDDRAVYGAQ